MAMAPLDFGGDDELGGYRPLSDINVTPFVDVMLVLLIVFMVAAPLMMSGVPLELPKTSAATLGQPKQLIIVSLNKEGKVFVRDDEIPPGGLIAHLSTLYQSDPNGTVYVRGDQGLPYGQIMIVMGQIGQAGFSRVSLIAESAPNER